MVYPINNGSSNGNMEWSFKAHVTPHLHAISSAKDMLLQEGDLSWFNGLQGSFETCDWCWFSRPDMGFGKEISLTSNWEAYESGVDVWHVLGVDPMDIDGLDFYENNTGKPLDPMGKQTSGLIPSRLHEHLHLTEVTCHKATASTGELHWVIFGKSQRPSHGSFWENHL